MQKIQITEKNNQHVITTMYRICINKYTVPKKLNDFTGKFHFVSFVMKKWEFAKISCME